VWTFFGDGHPGAFDSTKSSSIDGPGPDEMFGYSIAIDPYGESLLIGAPVTGSGGEGNSGRAYRYVWMKGWKYYTAYSTSTEGYNWGVSVAIGSDATCFAGATNANANQGKA
jgi:hypothetical protein